jgi:hypothetical protein
MQRWCSNASSCESNASESMQTLVAVIRNALEKPWTRRSGRIVLDSVCSLLDIDHHFPIMGDLTWQRGRLNGITSWVRDMVLEAMEEIYGDLYPIARMLYVAATLPRRGIPQIVLSTPLGRFFGGR